MSEKREKKPLTIRRIYRHDTNSVIRVVEYLKANGLCEEKGSKS